MRACFSGAALLELLKNLPFGPRRLTGVDRGMVRRGNQETANDAKYKRFDSYKWILGFAAKASYKMMMFVLIAEQILCLSRG